MDALLPRCGRPWVIAHRGASHACPENTSAAFALALAEGCDAIETDVRLSADGVPMLCHDADLRRLAGQALEVATRTADELEALPIPAPSGVPAADCRILRASAALARFPDVPFFLEMKGDTPADPDARRALAEATARVALAAPGATPHLLSFDDDLLAWAWAVAPDLARGRNMNEPGEYDYDYLSCSARGVTPAFVAASHAAGRPVLSFTVNDERALRAVTVAGVDGIFSDRPGWLRARLEAAPA